MRSLLIGVSAATLMLLAGCNQNAAQDTPAAADAPAANAPAAEAPAANADSNEAVDTTNNPEPGAPAAGANSFTEDQAMSRLTDSGYSNVTGLQKGDDGVWHGKAQKGGQTMDVTVDYQGNVTP
jgi:hypothetical protein